VLDVSLWVMAAILAAFGVALLWGGRSRPTAPPAPRRLPAPPATARRFRVADLYSGVFGVLLVVGAALLFLSSNNVLSGVRDAALTTVVVVVAIGLILAPFLWRLGRSLAAERAGRIRSQERSELAAHLHDSVLQTLTLMQKRADDPREVAALARRQERELRDWLAAEGPRPDVMSFASALRSAAEAVEDDHRVAVEVVTVGDCELDPRADAVLGAAREAFTNAAKHAAEPGPIRVYAEVKPGSVEVFVRDRGPGFDLATVPADRRGVRESIMGRMERAGGQAEVRASPGGGTEVALRIERSATTREDGPR
jgi:signal transduction histidine kinase